MWNGTREAAGSEERKRFDRLKRVGYLAGVNRKLNLGLLLSALLLRGAAVGF